MTESMSITKALVDLKLLDKRINKTIDGATFVSCVRGKDLKTMHGATKDELDKQIKADVKSIEDLIQRRKDIKSAIVISNANTRVEIAGTKLSVAEAIERKNSIGYEKQWVRKMKADLAEVETRMTNANAEVEAESAKLLNSMAARETEPLAIEETIQGLRNVNGVELFDPLQIEKLIKTKEDIVDTFEADVDRILSESNAVTRITV